MVSSRLIMGMACLAMASGAVASAPARLTLSLRGLEPAAEVSYHPYRWLTIRRGMAFVRTVPVDDVRAAGQSSPPRSRMRALTGTVHPFGDVLRLSFGVLEDDNRRLLRGSDAASAIGTGRYLPMASLGFAASAGNGLTIAADLGVLGNGLVGPRGSVLVMPMDEVPGTTGGGRGYRPMLHLSAGYRF